MVHFDQNLFGRMKSRQYTSHIIALMEVPVLDTITPPSDKYIIWTWIHESTKYQVIQYDHIMDHEGQCKYFISFRENKPRIINSLGKILVDDFDKHNLWLECFTGDAYEQYTTDVTNIQGNKDDVTEEDITTGLNNVANSILPYNAALKEWSYILGVTRKLEGMLMWELYTEMRV